jgi:hypothetical protein
MQIDVRLDLIAMQEKGWRCRRAWKICGELGISNKVKNEMKQNRAIGATTTGLV